MRNLLDPHATAGPCSPGRCLPEAPDDAASERSPRAARGRSSRSKPNIVTELPVLGRSEMRVFDVLAQERGRVLTWDELGTRVYGEPSPETRRLLRVHVSHIRQKLGNDCIVTVRGIGFRCGWQDVKSEAEPSTEDEVASSPAQSPTEPEKRNAQS